MYACGSVGEFVCVCACKVCKVLLLQYTVSSIDLREEEEMQFVLDCLAFEVCCFTG